MMPTDLLRKQLLSSVLIVSQFETGHGEMYGVLKQGFGNFFSHSTSISPNLIAISVQSLFQKHHSGEVLDNQNLKI